MQGKNDLLLYILQINHVYVDDISELTLGSIFTVYRSVDPNWIKRSRAVSHKKRSNKIKSQFNKYVSTEEFDVIFNNKG